MSASEASAAFDPVILERFRPRESDVFINTVPKAGTTWMQQILHQLRSGGDTTFESIYDVVPWLEFPGRQARTTDERLATLESLPCPRVFKTHLCDPPGIDIARFIVVGRDPRDCCVSGYHHLCGMTDDTLAWLGATRPDSFETYFERWLASDWEAHLRTWWSHRTSPRVLWVRFRDLKEDLPASLRQIAHFLEWQCDDATVQRAAAHASFSWMAAHRTKFTKFSRDDAPSWKPKSFIRAGRVGDHEAALSPSQSSRIRDLANAHLEPACVAFLGLPTT